MAPQLATTRTTRLALVALTAAVCVAIEVQPAVGLPNQITKIAVTDAMKARKNGGGPNEAPSSFWTPNIVVTTNGTVVIMAMAKPTFSNYMVSSCDGGVTWRKHAEPMGPPGTSQLVYSPTSDTLFLLGKSPNMVDNGTRPDPGNGAWLWQSKSMDAGMTWSEPAAINQTNPTYGPHYGGSGRTQGIELTRGPHKGRLVVAKIGASLAEQPIKPTHGKAGRPPIHAFAIYSDNNGETWALGDELGPKGSQSAPNGVNVWDEDTLTELKNGSVLLSVRIDDPEDQDKHHPDTNTTRVRTTRGFARSDDGAWTIAHRQDCRVATPRLLVNVRCIHTLRLAVRSGGATWSEVWTLYERQPEIYDSPCSDGLVSSEKTGAIYWGHPHGINGSRTNYTILRSMDQGAHWSILSPVVYPGGAGYSSLTLLPHAGPEDWLGVSFQRTIWDPNLEGGGYNIAFASVEVSPSTSTEEEAEEALAAFE